jgi:hypothetical protein
VTDNRLVLHGGILLRVDPALGREVGGGGEAQPASSANVSTDAKPANWHEGAIKRRTPPVHLFCAWAIADDSLRADDLHSQLQCNPACSLMRGNDLVDVEFDNVGPIGNPLVKKSSIRINRVRH